jgi:hypothetical protein
VVELAVFVLATLLLFTTTPAGVLEFAVVPAELAAISKDFVFR